MTSETSATESFAGFSTETLAALKTAGAAERWAAVQAHLHPLMVALAEAIRQAASRRFPREWPLYEISFKHQSRINRGAGERAPIDEYHMAIDRPPRGMGMYVVVDGLEERVFVALQLWSRRKDDLRRVWDDGRVIWEPLATRMNEVRFADRVQTSGDAAWLDRYLANRRASYLLAGFHYAWDDERLAQPAFAEQIVEDVLALLPLNEAVMEQAEALDPQGAALLREQRARYTGAPLPPIEQIVARIRDRGFALPDALIRAYHVALQTKPLVILPGISGTGKTRLTRLYADAVYADAAVRGQDNDHYLIVAVQPDWHNARDLLGYYNSITNVFHPTPFLRFLGRANADPAAQYYVCLDEMNLARPEYYLAPILSALETEDHQIDLGAPGATVTSVSGEVFANPFRLPLNVRITGTVNVDESTYTLSDKLLDRANVIELTDVDLDAFRASYREPVDETAWQVITQIHAILARAGQPFGYRTLAEMLRYLQQAQGVLSPDQALDQQIKQKILPKLRGEDTPRLRRALVALVELLLDVPQSQWGRAAQIEPAQVAASRYPDSAEKVRRMLERLDAEGFTDFYG